MQQGRVQLDADWNEQLAILHHRQAVDFMRGKGRSRSAIDPRRPAVGEQHVAGPVGRQLGNAGQAGCLPGPPPHRVLRIGAAVIRVGPHQEVQPVQTRLKRRRHGPRLERIRDGIAKPGRVDSQPDDDWSP